MRKIVAVIFLILLLGSLGSGCGGKGNKEEEFIFAFKEVFIVNLVQEGDQPNAQQAFLKVKLGLGLTKEGTVGDVGLQEFKVRDRINYILSRQTLKSIGTDSGKDNIKREIKEALNKFLTSGEVKDVFFYEFVTQ